jgi:cell division protein FtsZ
MSFSNIQIKNITPATRLKGEDSGGNAFRAVEPKEVAVATVKVIGVGGGGGNAINTMVRDKIAGVSFIAANTDKQALDRSCADILLAIGAKETRGLGAGADPEKGRNAAIESEGDIRAVLEGSEMVFITAGLGGGTGTGAAPVVAKISKEIGALTVAVVTKPFGFEGQKRMRNAEKGWAELKENADTIITVPNDRLLADMESNAKLGDMLAKADHVLYQAVKGISDLINSPGLINADFADLRTVMREKGPAVMGTGEASGEDRAVKAASMAIDNQLLEDAGIDGAKGVLINVSAAEETFGMRELNLAASLVASKVDEDATIITGALYDNSLGDVMRVTVVATGIGDRMEPMEPVTITTQARPNASGVNQVEHPVPAKPTLAPANPRNRKGLFAGGGIGRKKNIGSSNPPSKSARDDDWNNSEELETPPFLRRRAN